MVFALAASGPGIGYGLNVEPKLIHEIGLTCAVFALSGLQGALLAARFRVLALLPVVCVNLAAIVAVWAASRSQEFALLFEQMTVSGIAIQIGYLVPQFGVRALHPR